MVTNRLGRAAAVTTMALASLALAACGGSSSGTAPTTPTGSTADAKLQTIVDTALGPKGTYKTPPASAPHPKPGATIALISCGQQIEGCSEAMAAAKEAAGLIGWKTTLFDTKGDPTTAGTGIRQAVASKVDGIFLYAIDCPYVKAPLEQAKSAKIPVYQSQGLDCNEADPSAPSLFTGSNVYSDGEPFFDYIARNATAQTAYAILKNDNAAKVLYVGDDTLHLSKVFQNATKAATTTCSGCSYTQLVVPLTDVGTKLQGAVQQKLLQNPQINTILVPYQDLTLGGVNAAVRAAGRQNKMLVATGEGGPASMDLVRSGKGRYFGVGFSNVWEGWAAIDGLNRLLNGQKPANSGMGVQLYDADHNTPASGGYVPPVDFHAAYRASWGVGG